MVALRSKALKDNLSHPIISVVIPAYNEEKYLAKTLESLQHQTLNPSLYEVIVVDNDSTDSTANIAKRFGAKLVEEKNRGVLTARSAGLKAAQGSIFVSTDADTTLPPFWLGTIWKYFRANPDLVGLFGSFRLVKKDGKIYFSEGFYKLSDLFLSLNCRIRRPLFIGYNYAIKKEPFLEAGGFGNIAGDMDDVPTGLLAKNLGRVVFDPRLIAYSSARRIENEGLAKNLILTLTDYIRMAWLNESICRERKNWR